MLHFFGIRRPAQGLAGEQVQVNVEYGLAGILTAVHHYPVAIVGKAHVFGQLCRHPVKMADQLTVVFPNVIDGGNVFLNTMQT